MKTAFEEAGEVEQIVEAQASLRPEYRITDKVTGCLITMSRSIDALAKPVIVRLDTNEDPNYLFGEAYGIDWVYEVKK